MKYTVFRSLDRPSSFLGIKGRFIMFIPIGAGVFGLLGLFLAIVFGSAMLGVGFCLGGAVIGYIVSLVLQGRMSVRQLSRLLASRHYVNYVTVRSRRLVGRVDFFK